MSTRTFNTSNRNAKHRNAGSLCTCDSDRHQVIRLGIFLGASTQSRHPREERRSTAPTPSGRRASWGIRTCGHRHHRGSRRPGPNGWQTTADQAHTSTISWAISQSAKRDFEDSNTRVGKLLTWITEPVFEAYFERYLLDPPLAGGRTVRTNIREGTV